MPELFRRILPHLKTLSQLVSDEELWVIQDAIQRDNDPVFASKWCWHLKEKYRNTRAIERELDCILIRLS